MLIDGWDCIFCSKKKHKEEQTKYLDFLRDLLKDQSYLSLAYMTEILPIKKYSEQNMFTEISMTYPHEYAEFIGFMENEVQDLCDHDNMLFDEIKMV